MQVYANSTALVVSTENITQNWCAVRPTGAQPVKHSHSSLDLNKHKHLPSHPCTITYVHTAWHTSILAPWLLPGAVHCMHAWAEGAALPATTGCPDRIPRFEAVNAAQAANGVGRYFGNQRSMLIPNCLFRVGGAAVVLSNKLKDSWRAK